MKVHVIVECIGFPLSIFSFFLLICLSSLFLFPYPHLILQRVISNCNRLFIKEIVSSGKWQESGKAKELRMSCVFLPDTHLSFGRDLHAFKAARDSRRLLLVSSSHWIPQAHSLLFVSSRMFVTITWILLSKGECWTMEPSTHLASTQPLN